jgi:hypothetical protein
MEPSLMQPGLIPTCKIISLIYIFNILFRLLLALPRGRQASQPKICILSYFSACAPFLANLNLLDNINNMEICALLARFN